MLAALVMSVPLNLVSGVVQDRADYSRETVATLSSEWGGSQLFSGPLLTIPVTEEVTYDRRREAVDALTGLTLAEKFRDEGRDVLLFIDNIFRFSMSGSEVSALLGRMPSAVGYQPTLATEMGELQERITSTRKGSITSMQAVYVPADDYTDPAPVTTFAHLDATISLERSIASLGIYPAVDPLGSSSRILDPVIVGEEHYNVARGVQSVLQRFKDLQDIIAILGIDELSEEDRLVVGRARRIQRFLAQPMFVAEKFTGQAGVYTPLEETIGDFAPGFEVDDLEVLVSRSDVVTLHVPLERGGRHPTHDLFDERMLASMRPGAWLFNTARGGVVNESALVAHVARPGSGPIVLDVWASEPEPETQSTQEVAHG